MSRNNLQKEPKTFSRLIVIFLNGQVSYLVSTKQSMNFTYKIFSLTKKNTKLKSEKPTEKQQMKVAAVKANTFGDVQEF